MQDPLKRILFFTNIFLSALSVSVFIMFARENFFMRADFTCFYAEAAMVRDGMGESLYDLSVVARFQEKVLDGRRFGDGVLPYSYPPHAALFFLPLAALFQRSTAFYVWSFCLALILIWLLFLLRALSRSRDVSSRRFLTAALLAFPPLFAVFKHGTLTLLMVVVLTQFYLNLKANRNTRAGLWLMAASLKPQLILLPVCYLMAARKWGVLLSAAFAALTIFIVSSLCLGWGVWLDFFHTVLSVNKAYDTMGVAPHMMYNFKGLLTVLSGNRHGAWINLASHLMLLASILFSLWLWQDNRRSHQTFLNLVVGFTLALGFFFSPHLHPHDGLLFVLPAALFYDFLKNKPLSRERYTLFLTACPLIFLLTEAAFRDTWLIRAPVVCVIFLFVWMAFSLRHELRRNVTLEHNGDA